MPSPNISFDEIPGSIRKPGKYFEFNTKLAVRTLPNNKQKLLIIGQRTSSGSVAEAVPTKVFSDKEAETYFGPGSMCHLMVRAAIKANPYLDLTVVALDDAGAGVVATGTITPTGPATSAGVLTLYIGNAKVQIAIADEDTAAEIGAALEAELDKHSDLPVSAAVVVETGVVTLTAKNKGLCGNDIHVAVEVTASGVTATVVAMASGATNPDIQDALDAVFAEKYDIVATPYNNEDDLGTLKTHLDLVSGPLEQRPGVGVYGMNGALADATTLSALVNSGRILCAYLRYTGTLRRSMPSEIASAMGAVMAYEEDPARPLNTLELTAIAVPLIGDRLSRTEQESLLYNGVTPNEIGPGEIVQIVRAISTYLLDPQGVEDISLLDITTIRTLDYVRKACRERVALRFPREKLSTKTPPKVRSEIIDVLKKLEELEIVEEVNANLDGLIVERDSEDPNRLNAKIPADIVNGLHVFAGRIDLLL